MSCKVSCKASCKRHVKCPVDRHVKRHIKHHIKHHVKRHVGKATVTLCLERIKAKQEYEISNIEYLIELLMSFNSI